MSFIPILLNVASGLWIINETYCKSSFLRWNTLEIHHSTICVILCIQFVCFEVIWSAKFSERVKFYKLGLKKDSAVCLTWPTRTVSLPVWGVTDWFKINGIITLVCCLVRVLCVFCLRKNPKNEFFPNFKLVQAYCIHMKDYLVRSTLFSS